MADEQTTEQQGLLSQKQLSLILSTWGLCKAGKVDEKESDPGLRETGIIMFLKLFEICPEVLQLFPFADEPVINSETEGLVKHGLDVMGVIDSALSMVVNMEIDKLVDFLVELGLAHSLRNVEPKHFAPVAEALIHALATKSGDAFTDEAKNAWVTLYSVVQAKMLEGMAALEDDEEDTNDD